MIDLRAPQPGWNRRDFLKSAAVVGGFSVMGWGLASAADIPMESTNSMGISAAEARPQPITE